MHHFWKNVKNCHFVTLYYIKNYIWAIEDLNLGPKDYESSALTN